MKSPSDFDLLKAKQFCDNPDCSHYNLKDADNIRTHSRAKGQVYCTACKNRWVITKGTIRFGLKTPIRKIITTLQLMANGMGLRKASRQQEVSPETASQWIEQVNSILYENPRWNIERRLRLQQLMTHFLP